MAQTTVFEQIIKLIPRTLFQEMVTRNDADKGLRTLDSWTWFGSLLFGQLTGHDSIRAIERVFAHSDSKMRRLGFGPVRKSTLADANAARSLGLLEEVFNYCLGEAAPALTLLRCIARRAFFRRTNVIKRPERYGC